MTGEASPQAHSSAAHEESKPEALSAAPKQRITLARKASAATMIQKLTRMKHAEERSRRAFEEEESV